MPERTEPGSGLALYAALVLEGRKEGWAGGKRRSVDPGALWRRAPGLPGASPGGQPHPTPRISSKEPRATFTFGPVGLCPGHAGSKAKAQMGAGGEITEANFSASLPGGPQQPRELAGGCHCLKEKTEGGPREGLGPTQGHIASEGFPSANPRPILFLTTPLVAVWQREGREEVAPVPSPALGKLTVNLTEVWGLPLEGFLVLSTGWDPPGPPSGQRQDRAPPWFQRCCPRLVVSRRPAFTLDRHILSLVDSCPFRSWTCHFSLPPCSPSVLSRMPPPPGSHPTHTHSPPSQLCHAVG